MPGSIGESIRRARLAQGLTLAELASKLGSAGLEITGAGISHWETGRASPSENKIKKLEQILGLLTVPLAGQEEPPIDAANSIFGVWLRKARTDVGLSVPELARAAGISPVAIYHLEAGRSQNPQSETKAKLERALNRQIPEEVKAEIIEDQKIEGLGALTDFDPHDRRALPNAPGVYVFYDISERPIYIGKAANIADRVLNHFEKFWFKSPIVYTGSYIEIPDEKVRH